MIIIPGRNKNLTKRYFANVIDYLILTVVLAIYIFSFGTQDENGTYRVTGWSAMVVPLIWFIYFPVTEAVIGQTLGKKAFNLYVVDVNGISPSIIQTTMRRMLDFFELMFVGIPALITINHSPKNQRISDMIAGTTVITTSAVCRFCNTEVELTKKEVTNNVFVCPFCSQTN